MSRFVYGNLVNGRWVPETPIQARGGFDPRFSSSRNLAEDLTLRGGVPPQAWWQKLPENLLSTRLSTVAGFVKEATGQAVAHQLLRPITSSNVREADAFRWDNLLMQGRANTGRVKPHKQPVKTHKTTPKTKPVPHKDVMDDPSDWSDPFPSNTGYGGGGGEMYQAMSGQGGRYPSGGRPRKIPVEKAKPYGMPRGNKKKSRSQAKNSAPVHGGINRQNLALGRLQNLPGDAIQVELRSVKVINTDASGDIAISLLLGDGSGTTPTVSFDTYLGKLANFYNMYDWCRFIKLRFEYQPNVSYATTGYVGMAIDPNPRAAAPSDIQDVSRHLHSITGDCKQAMVLEINANQLASQSSGRASWFTTEDGADLEWRAPGVFQLRGNFTEAGTPVNADIGHLHMYAVIQCKGLNRT